MPSRFVWTLDLTCPDMGWKQLAKPMRNRRKDPQTIVVDGKLYVFGGLKGYEPIPEDRSSGRGWMEVYDPILETWESLPNPPSYTSVNVYFVMGFRPFRPNYFTCTAHLYLYCTLLVPHTYASYIRH